MSVLTRARVRAAATRLGYRADSLARGLSTGQSLTVGVLVADIRNPSYAELVRGIEGALEAAGYVALITNTDWDLSRQRRLVEKLLDRRVDGLLVTLPYNAPLLTGLSVPVV